MTSLLQTSLLPPWWSDIGTTPSQLKLSDIDPRILLLRRAFEAGFNHLPQLNQFRPKARNFTVDCGPET